ncbi:DUF423 domain-containing protein [Sphingomonas solaris]|uniref:DUF423 domain-containing protein n=2 Tax=Alterirhizorhabdus solaris TaxID=2529389 RepID=A0A558QXG7_9SPHN|nr:DUF423 domain-containing protein [Sphingomonas solaris]
MIVALAAFSGAMAVMAGAFGAHGASGKAAEWLRTGALYQMVHAVAAIVATGLPRGRGPAWLFVAGGGLFAGTLYAMALGGPRVLGAITPIGGAALIGGWLWLAAGSLRR